MRAIEGRGCWPRNPIVAIAASAMPAERQRCLDAGMDHVQIKPLMLDTLSQVLACLGRRNLTPCTSLTA